MGKRARAAGLANAALRAAQAARRVQDEEAHQISSEVYATCTTVRADLADEPGSVLNRYPMWMLGPLQYVSGGAAVVVAPKQRLPEERVAAYFFALLMANVEAMVGSFDREHFDRWTQANAGG